MSRTHASAVPRTPGGVHFRFADISADEIEFDDEIAVKSSVFRGRTDSPSRESETSFSKKHRPVSRNSSKFILRKSTDLRKIRRIDDKIEAILASPMIEVRHRPLKQSKLFTADLVDYERTPIRVPASKDLAAVSSRRMSAIVMSKFASFGHSVSFSEGNQSLTRPAAFNRRRTTGNPETPFRYSTCSKLGSPKYKNTPVSPVQKVLPHERSEIMDIDGANDYENIPPLENAGQSFQDGQAVSSPQIMESRGTSPKEPTSVSEFRVLVRLEASRLSSAKAAWEDVMSEEGESIPETAISSIRAAVGKCGLLLAKKFPFFSSLVDLTEASLRQQQDEVDVTPQQRASINDLLGMWAIISQQIADIDKSFERLRRWREVSGWAFNTPPVTPARITDSLSIKKRKGLGGSHLSRPIQPSDSDAFATTPAPKLKPKGTLKVRLLSSSNKSNSSKLHASKLVRHSNFSQFKRQLMAKKKEMEGSVDTLHVSSQKCDSLATTSKCSRSQVSVVGSQSSNIMVKMKNTPLKTPRRGRLFAQPAAPATESASPDIPLKASSSGSKLQSGRQQPKPLGLSKGIEGNVDSVLDASANTTETEDVGDSFAVPLSRPRKRIRKEHIASPQSASVINTSHPFSPSSRPATGTPRPHISRQMKVKADISLEHSPLSKDLMTKVSFGNGGTVDTYLTSRDKKSAPSPKLTLASTPNGRLSGSEGDGRELTATLNESDLVDSLYALRPTRRQRASTPLR
ncbi:unnamed protein product [Hydatigera taeniaeformis]|uniref:Disks large-associated protein 5 n=1 Tax=Hydatigena taeniaeformis TaxID=6205 RepID=A0A0R3X6B4_HYDTA|nr:unnamed protein product [Hydatigera taeniaeformis]